MSVKKHAFATRVIHAGYNSDKHLGAVTPPIYQTSVFKLSEPGKTKYGFDYSRNVNPTRAALEECIADLEGGKYCLAFSSGMAAINNCIYLLTSGDHIVASQDIYGGTFRYFVKVASKYDIDVDFVDMCEPENVERAIKENTKMIWIETPSNPLLKITDMQKISQIAQKHRLITVADNTFMTPLFQNPLEWGIDIVVHSCSKYIGGHSDIIAGALVTSKEDIYQVMKFHQFTVGAVPSPFDCFLMLRGIKTLSVRMEAHQANARALAEFLNDHPKVKKVYYPAFPSASQYITAAKQMRGFGGVVSFELDCAPEDVNKFLKNLHVFAISGSLGGVESHVSVPYHMSHAPMPADFKERVGIAETLVRLSVGIEDINDLQQDLDNALKTI